MADQPTIVVEPTAAAVIQHGQAPIKKEFLDLYHEPKIAEHLPENVLEELTCPTKEISVKAADEEPIPKRPRLKGRNKKRPIEKNPEAETKFCPQLLAERECPFGDGCKFMHDVNEYMEKKLPDLGDTCYIFDTYGYCPYSFACRFASKHLTKDGKNIKDDALYEKMKDKKGILNVLDKDTQRRLWKKKYDFSLVDSVWKRVKKAQEQHDSTAKYIRDKSELTFNKQAEMAGKPTQQSLHTTEGTSEPADSLLNVPEETINADCDMSSKDGQQDCGPVSLNDAHCCDTSIKQSDTEGRDSMKLFTDVFSNLKHSAKKTIDFHDKLYLAPLTTVGNLPFRRICKRFGADITCSEMALCTNLLQGKQSEWALLKRHESEDLFGAQLCGSFPDTMTRCAHVITNSVNVDFIDINCGCPIDLIFKKGEGCALMGRPNRFETIVRSMTSVMDIPLTVKLRTGIYENKSIAHTLLPRLRDWGVSMVTLHGRSREQRYTRLADWKYIAECAKVSSPMPLFGNGDILSYEDYLLHRQETGISGAMIARGALIKPWIFTEIKEQRHWDISASERFDILRDFTNFGLEYWGSDQQGVTITRRFLLEWLSFLYRYIPVGLLERLPQRINEKPPYYFGRNDLETMMASPSCADWIKISEMLLGSVPDGFVFLPKHKASAYK